MSSDSLLLTIPIIVVILGFLIVSYFSYQRNLQAIKRLRSSYLDQVEEERKNLSNELHDSINLLTLPLKIFISQRGKFDDENAEEWNGRIHDFEQYLANFQNSIYPYDLLMGNLFEALENLETYLILPNGSKITVNTSNPCPINKKMSIHIFRIVQESIVNAFKHSKPKHLVVNCFSQERDLHCIIKYDAEAIPAVTKRKNSRGTHIIKERLERVNGTHSVMLEDLVLTEKFVFRDAKTASPQEN